METGKLLGNWKLEAPLEQETGNWKALRELEAVRELVRS
jgi:hypothetical protein